MAANNFESQDMVQTLPVDGNASGGSSDGGSAHGSQAPVIEGWKKQQTEDYTSGDPVTAGEASEGTRPLYPWAEPEMGDVGPKIPGVELELFGPEGDRASSGLDFTKITQISVTQESEQRVSPIKSFQGSNLHPVLVENIALAGYDSPTPIQQFVIPAVLSGKDVIGIAQTGSGKTAAYLIPILSMLMGKAKRWCAPRPCPTDEEYTPVKAEPLVLIIVPTRELAVQIFNEARKFAYRSMLRPCVVYGGPFRGEQSYLLGKGCDILIGTPGRLKDFINRPEILTLARLKYTVIDEADEMLQESWADQLDPILQGGEQDEGNIKYCLFSATFPKEARIVAQEYLSEQHVRIRVGRAGSTTSNIMQKIIRVDRNDRRRMLIDLLTEFPGVRTIIFVNAVQEVDNLDDFLFNQGLPVTSTHSGRSQKEREAALRAFRSGKEPILVASGVAGRGIDVRNVAHVINYDLPTIDHGGIEDYTHRIGRTGRIGNRGLATSFFTERDEELGSVLARTLLEADQEIPDFLNYHITEGMTKDTVKFETESDFDEDDLGEPGDLGAVDKTDGAAAATGGWGVDDAADNNAGDAGAWGVNDDAVDAAPAW